MAFWRRKPKPVPVPLPASGLVAEAQRLLRKVWGARGFGGSEAADALRKLTVPELRLMQAWIPTPPPNTPTGAKCARAREIVAGVLAEKE